MRRQTHPIVGMLVPLTGLTKELVAQRRACVDSLLAGRAELMHWVLEDGPAFIETTDDERQASDAILAWARLQSEPPADAIVVWCAGDPAATQLQEVLGVPVIGPGTAAIARAGATGSFGIVSPDESELAFYTPLVSQAGLDARLVGYEAMEMPVGEIAANRGRALERAESAARRLARRGADAAVLGCMALGGIARQVSAAAGIPVFDPVEAAVTAALDEVETKGGHL